MCNNDSVQSKQVAEPDKGNKRSPENQEKIMVEEIKMIQDIIKRLTGNCFLLKGWTVSLITATVIFKGSQGQGQNIIWIFLLPVVVFWLLDAYYLKQERLFRAVHKWVIKNRLQTDERLFDFDTDHYKGQVAGIFKVMFSSTLLFFYGGILLLFFCYWFFQGGHGWRLCR